MAPPSTNPPAASRNHPGNYSTGDSATRMSSVEQSAQPRSKTANQYTETQRYPEVREPRVSSEDIIAQLHQALIQCENDLKEERTKHAKALAVNRNQLDTIKAQAATISEQHRGMTSLEVLQTIMQKHLSPYAMKHDTMPAKWTKSAILEVAAALSKDAADANASAADAVSSAAEVTSLSEQVRTLQKEMLAKLERVSVASDEELAQEFRVIIALVKTLSRTVRIDETKDISTVFGPVLLLQNVSPDHLTGRAQKKLLVEAWVWSVLLQNVFQTPFVIFGDRCKVLNATWSNIYLGGHFGEWPKPTALSETWRFTTTESVLALVDRDVITHGKVKEMHQYLEPDILALRKEIYNTIGSHLSKVSTGVEGPQIQNIVNKSFAFAMNMSLQRIRLRITYPPVGAKFSMDSMKLMPDTDDEDVHEATVTFIVNPGLTKWGDMHGKNFDHRYDIVPALVQIAVPPKHEVAEAKPGPPDWADIVRMDHKEASLSKGECGKKEESQR
ncbi:predicted protein [Pyrenophora tritici-repentis Pt-1C-BFP]|uniref:Uncharacterized protein n=2 Tax=Pyrenophora tritici-repentis TaxID=45151 RepID=A0A922T236_9PLEO|nr:uncharacterized protein PTRG_02501 [Pyrenophora tritici-repentis Pt-1C-BFP]EDU45024.1 predicted protein [Pyrenophora tritici-repentis Pt-1C-BFP]KAI1518500.1 hypothetical protein Ptr86124_001628 [Pyrenophora tritici-repentis]KAI1686075.1 hypothetical protein KJE20_04040 [Pyrenophora tritici-repentis]